MENDVLIRFRLVGQEAKALLAWAAAEHRHPREQVRFLLQREFRRRGLLPPTNKPADEPAQEGTEL